MNTSSEGLLKFLCPHCGRHLSGEPAWAGQQIACPVCQGELVVPGGAAKVSPVAPPGGEPERWWQRKQVWIDLVGLLVLGAATPFLVFLAMCFSALTGPLVLVVAPVLGFVVSRMACGYVYENHSSRWFFYYVCVTAVTWCLLLKPVFWPSAVHGGGVETEWGALAHGLSGLMEVAAAVIWLVAAIWTWPRSGSLPET